MAEATDKIVGIYVDPIDHNVFELSEVLGTCKTLLPVYPQLVSIGQALMRSGMAAWCSFFIVAPEWKMGEPIDIYRCTYRDPRNAQP